MSDLGEADPPTNGRVVVITTHGNLDVELWSNECPKACRNFLQLCADGYYDNCIFHRIIPHVLVQTGDPSGTGQGGESIYNNPSDFTAEYHPRLKFHYPGMLGLVAHTEETDGKNQLPTSATWGKFRRQFFFTLAPDETLNGRYPLVGKVSAASLDKLFEIGSCSVDPTTGRPLEPIPRILATEVVASPSCAKPTCSAVSSNKLDDTSIVALEQSPANFCYSCRSCRWVLFSQSNTVRCKPSERSKTRLFAGPRKIAGKTMSRKETAPKDTCTSIFIEPMSWMQNVTEQEGRLTCRNNRCGAKLGSYSWYGIRCSCGAWQTPGFQIHAGKVDRLPQSTTYFKDSMHRERTAPQQLLFPLEMEEHLAASTISASQNVQLVAAEGVPSADYRGRVCTSASSLAG